MNTKQSRALRDNENDIKKYIHMHASKEMIVTMQVTMTGKNHRRHSHSNISVENSIDCYSKLIRSKNIAQVNHFVTFRSLFTEFGLEVGLEYNITIQLLFHFYLPYRAPVTLPSPDIPRLMEGVDDASSHVHGHRCSDKEGERPDRAAPQVQYGVKDPTTRVDPKQHLGEEQTWIGVEEEECQHKEDWDVLDVVLMSSPHALHFWVRLGYLGPERSGVLGVNEGPAGQAT